MSGPRQNKVLVVGSVSGKFDKLFKRVRDVNLKAGPFDLLLCVGDFFGDDPKPYDELINGSQDLPNVSTYVVGRFPAEFRRFHPDVDNFGAGFDIVDGITYMGQSGVLNTSSGLRFAYLAGEYRSEEGDNKDLEYFSKKQYDSLLANVSSSNAVIDIFLTNQWPKNILDSSNNALEPELVKQIGDSSSALISQIVQRIKPRYYFVGGSLNAYFEREPYRNHNPSRGVSRNVTRFLSIGQVLNPEKRKWIYAFNLVPGSELPKQELIAQPENVTENPLLKVGKALEDPANDEAVEGSQQFFFSAQQQPRLQQQNPRNQKNRRPEDDQQQDQRPRKNLKIDTSDCWFCLGNVNADKSLIVSIGDHSYLALAKGGLSDTHLLITPIEHVKSYKAIEDNTIREEIQRFKRSLEQYFDSIGMVPVFFERNFRTAHFQINVVGIPKDKITALKDTSRELFGKFEVKEFEIEDEVWDSIVEGERYFYLECPNIYRFLVMIHQHTTFFPVQIGRELFASKDLLDCQERMNWKNCILDKDQAMALTKKTRAAMKPFDFTLQ